MIELVNFWKKLDFSSTPYIHPEDVCITSKHYHSFIGLENYLSKDYWSNTGTFHPDLLPVPYLGNLQSAKIFILLLNPGFSISDYFAEQTSKDFVAELTRTLFQENMNPNFPFLFLNPAFMWHAGGQYWLNKLKIYIQEAKGSMNISHLEALAYVSQNVAILELVPYHSNNFKHKSLINKLESSRQMKIFIDRFLMPKVISNKACVICTRQVKEWGLPNHNNIITYQNAEARAAHLSKKSSAFSTISKFLLP